MDVNKFIHDNIKRHLIGCGLDSANAEWCAQQGVIHYKQRIGNSKNAFNEACDYAGLMAGQRSLTFKYASPKAMSKPRAKRPQEAFDFKEQN